ncbi:MAG: urate oxidase [Spirochaetaceae bacterium]|nr:urate oxidase [Spirochaetaceae bacterium]
MAIVLGDNQYGKAETHVVRVVRDTARHEIRDLVVSSALRGSFDDAHLTGNQSAVLPTDTQKNTVFAFAKQVGISSPEQLAVALARHFADDVDTVSSARVTVEEHLWERAVVDGAPHDHTFVQSSQEVRTVAVTVEGGRTHVLSGLTGLVLLKSTGSEFSGFLVDEYTTLAPTTDRVMATSVSARWRWSSGFSGTDDLADHDHAYGEVRDVLVSRFGALHSLALQQTLWEMGRSVLETREDIAEIRLSAPNRHHFPVDLTPFGLDNAGEVFWAADRPYGLIEVEVRRDEADADRDASGPAWRAVPGFL